MGQDFISTELERMTVYGIGSDVASYILRDVRFSSWFRAVSRPALYRIQTILASLINGEPVTTRRMALRLEVSARTVARDIDYLINTLHVPISYDSHHHTYLLKGPVPVLFAPHAGAPSESDKNAPDVLVTLDIDVDLVRHFQAVELHPSQRLVVAADGSALLYLTVPANDVLVQWVMSYGGRLRVVSPPELRARVHHLAMSMTMHHKPNN